MHMDSLHLELSTNMVLIIKTIMCKFEHHLCNLCCIYSVYRILYLIITLDYFLLSNVTSICTHVIHIHLYTYTFIHTYMTHFKCEYMQSPCFSNLMSQVKRAVSIHQTSNFEKGDRRR